MLYTYRVGVMLLVFAATTHAQTFSGYNTRPVSPVLNANATALPANLPNLIGSGDSVRPTTKLSNKDAAPKSPVRVTNADDGADVPLYTNRNTYEGPARAMPMRQSHSSVTRERSVESTGHEQRVEPPPVDDAAQSQERQPASAPASYGRLFQQ